MAMYDFDYCNQTELIFGRRVEARVGEKMAALGRRVLLVYGRESIRRSGLYDRVRAGLAAAGLTCFELGGVQANPRLDRARSGVELCRRNGVDCILAVGGGSVMDTAKAVSVGVNWEGDLGELAGKPLRPGRYLPVGVIVTIPASGSENSDTAILTREEDQQKFGIAVPRPVFAMLNPELTYTLPPYQTACGVADMLSHVMERYFAHPEGADLTDRLCEGVMRSIIRSGPIALRKPDDYEIRSELMWAGAVAHGGFLGVGRAQDWAAHEIEHQLNAFQDLAHGAGMAILFPAWCRFIAPERKARFVQFAVRVWDVNGWFGDPDAIIEEGICRMERFFWDMGIPTRLSHVGIPEAQFPQIAARSAGVGAARPLSCDDVMAILHLAN